jgi:hypothetical protein
MSATALDSSVTLDEVFTVVATKRVPLAPELAGYLVLELAEHADPGGGDIDPKSVFVGEEGTVALVKPKREGGGDPEASIRAALARLLDASGSQTPALAVASKRKSGSGLAALAEELEAALIPVNRSAARRALARLAREVKRVTLGVGRAALQSTSDAGPPSRRSSAAFYTPAPPSTSVPPTASEQEPPTARTEVPAEVLRQATPQPLSVADPEPAASERADSEREPPTIEFHPADASPSQADVDALIATFAVSEAGDARQANQLKAMAGLEPTPPPPSTAREERRPVSRGAAPGQTARVDQRLLQTQPSKLRQRTSLPSVPSAKPSRGTTVVVVLALVALAAGAVAVWRLRPSTTASPTPQPSEPSAPVAVAPASCRGTLIVTDVPPHAEVLLRQGQAPVDVERMPVGSRLEFVATAEGFSPKRVIVPADATWDATPEGKPRLEIAVQLDKSHARPGANDPWPASEPGSTVGGNGAPGTVHVVATPRGAEIWLLAGIGPDARIDQVSCNEDVDILLAGPATYRKRLHVVPGDFVPESAAAPADPKLGVGVSDKPGRHGAVARVSGK